MFGLVRWIGAFVVVVCIGADRGALFAEGEKAPKGSIDISYDPPPQPLPNLGRGELCRNVPATREKDFRTDKTIAELLGPEVQSIKVHYYSKEKWDKFEQVKSVLGSLLAAKSNDGTIYAQTPWAEGVSPSIVATIEYKNKTKGAMQIGGAGTHLCFQDQKGVHWWTRLTPPPAPPKK
jgi:hypothetical protein